MKMPDSDIDEPIIMPQMTVKDSAINVCIKCPISPTDTHFGYRRAALAFQVLGIFVVFVAGCVDEGVSIGNEQEADVAFLTVGLTTDAIVGNDAPVHETTFGEATDALDAVVGERTQGNLLVISSSEALSAHVARMAKDDPEWGALLDAPDQAPPASLDFEEAAAKMEKLRATRVPNIPTGLTCSHPAILAAEKRLVPHVSSAKIAAVPLVPVDRDVTRTLPTRRFRGPDSDQIQSIVRRMRESCARLDNDPNTKGKALTCFAQVAKMPVHMGVR